MVQAAELGAVEGPNDGIETKVHAKVTGLPRADGMSLSFWLEGVRNNELLDHRSTADLPSSADIVVIGSGLTGSLAALKLLESRHPPRSIVMLEAREFCSGATGRNAGHCKPDQYRGFTKYRDLHGTEQALKILANEWDTWEKLVTFVREENVDCDISNAKNLDVLMTDKLAAEAAEKFEALAKAGGRTDHIIRITEPCQAEEVSLSPARCSHLYSRVKGARAVYAWSASNLYPWKLAAHVVRKALKLGLNLQTWTSAKSVEASDTEWVISTPRGAIRTPTVLHATNAYAGVLLPETKGPIRPTPHMCNKVIPPTSFSGSRRLTNSYGILCEGGLFSVNPRPTSDGIMLVGGSNPNNHLLSEYVAGDPARRTDDGLQNFEPVTRAVRDMTQNLFDWGGEKLSGGSAARYGHQWSGIVGQSADKVPFIGAVPGKPGQWICAGHNGHGMARIFTAAPAIAMLMQGAEWKDTCLPECFEVTAERLARCRAMEAPPFHG